MSDRTAVISADKVDSSAAPTLVPQGPFLGKPDIPLNRSVITVGSGDKSRLHLVSSTISSAHALLVKSAGQTYIADLASRTGIQINGKPTSFSYLKPGDRLQIGRFVFRFRSPQASTNFPPSPPPASVDVTGELPIDLGEKPVFTIGRRDNNDLPLTGDRNVSTVHAVIFAVDGQWYLRDLHTRTGTKLNGSGIHQHQLDFNDEIQIGSFKMRFQPAATDSPASASGLDFSVEAATTTAEPLEMDLPPLAVDEDAAIPLEVDEPLSPRADRPEVPLAPVIPVEDLAPVPTEEVEAPLEVADPFVEAELPIPEPDEVDMSPLEALEPLPDLEVDPSSPVEAEAVIPEVEPTPVEPLAEIPLELEEPAVEVEALSPVEVEPVAEPVAEVPLEVEEPKAEPVAATPVEHEENPFAAAEPLAEAPLEVEEPAIEPVAETADIHSAAAAEPEELDFAALESLEPDLLSSAAPDEIAAVEEPAIEPVAEAPDIHAAAAAEPEELDLSALEPFEPELPSTAAPEEVPAEEIHATAVEPQALSEENPFAEPLAEVLPEVEEPAIEPVAETAEVHPAAAAEPEELDLSALESFQPDLLESPATEEVPAAEIYPAAIEPQPAAELPLVLEDLDEASTSAPGTPAAEVDDLDQSLLESLEEFPIIESEPSPPAALDLEDLTAEPAAVPLPTYSDLSEEPVASLPQAELEPPSTIPADVADLIYTTEEPPPAPAAPEPAPAKPAKPKRKWWSRKKKERTPPPPPIPTPPAVEILDATEPTLESALEMSAAADAPTPDVSSESLSDTTFSRAVEEFAGASTGPIVEEPLHSAEKTETEPASPPLTLDEITDGEEFVAVPEAEPEAPLEVAEVQPQSHTEVFQPPSLTYTSTQDNQQTLAESTPVETAPPVDEPTVTDPALSEPPPVKTSTAPPPPFEPLPISTAAQPPLAPPPTSVTASRPSIFGFQFDGGSFLGGMPLRLKPLTSETNKTVAPPPVEAKPESRIEPPPPAPVEPAPAPTIIDDVPPAEPIEPPPATLVEPTPAAPPLTFTNYAPSAEPVVMPIKQPPPAPPVAPQPTAATIKTPPRPAPLPRPKRLADAMAVPPMAQSVPTTTPPRRNLTTAFDGLAPRSLTGGMVAGQQKTPPPVRGFGVPGARETVRGADVFSQVAAPISVEVFGGVQGNANDFVIPDTRKLLMPTPPRTPPGPPPTSAFGNSDNNGNGDIEPPPTEEEFQQAGIPTEPLTDMLEPPQDEPPIALPADADPVPQPHHQPQVNTPKPRRSRVPVLLMLMILLLAGAWAGVYYLLSPASRVTGTLAFSNLAAQPMSDQLIFQQLQNARLHSEEVRSMARSMLVSGNQDPGFLDDAVQFEQALTKTGKVEFVDNGEKLQLTTRVSDATLGKTRVDALLQSLKQKDTDLVDLQARAKRAYDDAQAAVTQTKAHLDDLQAQRTAAQARGENRPDPQEIASVTADDERLNKAWTLAKSDLADTQTALTDLQSLSTDKPPTADTDPQLTRLRRESGDLDQQISALQLIVDAGHSTLDQDNQLADLKTQSDDLATSMKQRQSQILADQALTPQQREVNRQKAIEALSVKLTDLQKAESDAKSAANASAVRLAELNTRLTQARQASTDDLITQISAARDDLKAKTDDASEKDKQLNACVSLAGDPQVSVQALSDQRPIFAGGASVVILIIFSLMIVSASRSATTAIADRPAPHPQPHPADDADEPSPASL